MNLKIEEDTHMQAFERYKNINLRQEEDDSIEKIDISFLTEKLGDHIVLFTNNSEGVKKILSYLEREGYFLCKNVDLEEQRYLNRGHVAIATFETTTYVCVGTLDEFKTDTFYNTLDYKFIEV